MKLFAFVVSAVLAGIAGALYVPQVGIINPGEFASGQLDRGGDLGRRRRPRHHRRADHRRASSSMPARSIFTGAFPDYWLFALGGLFVVVTLFLPKGIVGLVTQTARASEGQGTRAPPPRTARTRPPCPSPRPRRSLPNDRRRSGTMLYLERRLGLASTASRRSTICRSSSTPPRCSRSSAPTAPARRR